MTAVKIGRKVVGDGKPAFIVAEIASAHQGDVETCKELVNKIGRAGADAVKFQKFIADELVVPAGPRYENLKRIEFTGDEWRDIFSSAKRAKREILADVFDERSCDFMDGLGVSAFKIHSTDLMNPYMISHVAAKRKPILLGVGGGTHDEIKKALGLIKSHGNDIILIHGFQAYPTRLEDTNMKLLLTLKETFGLNVGYHDHVDAESELALFLPCLAVAFGASVIEKHVILDRSGRGLDYQSALTPDEFKKMVKSVRDFENAIGPGKFEFSAAEKKYRDEVRKNIVARVDIPSGTKIELHMLAFKRSKPGLPPSDAAKVLGKKARTNINKDEIITWDKLL